MLMNAVGPCVEPDGVGPARVVVRTSTRNRVATISQPAGSEAALGTAYHVTVRQAFASAWLDVSDPRMSTTATAPTATSIATTLKTAATTTVLPYWAPDPTASRSLRLIPATR